MAFQLDVSFCFIDFRAAFNSLDHEMMYKIMKSYGLPQKVVNVIRNSYEGFKCCVNAEGEKGQMFDVKTGVRQGDVWSPIPFGLVINYVMTNSIQGGIDIGRCVADLDFADDVALLGVSDSDVQANLHRIEFSAEAVGLMINVGKTKKMGFKCERPGANVPIAQKNVEVLTGNHKGRFGTLIESENQSRLLIGREVLVGKKNQSQLLIGREVLVGKKWLLIWCLRRVTDHLRSLMTRVVYFQVVNVASTLQEAAKFTKPDFASLRIRRVSKTVRQSLLG